MPRQMYHEATETVSLPMGVRRRECQNNGYDGRSPVDRLSDAGSIPARSIKNRETQVSLFFYGFFDFLIVDHSSWQICLAIFSAGWFQRKETI